MTLAQLLDSTERNTWLEDFPGAALDEVTENGWDVLDAGGVGGSLIAVAGSQLTISAGTTIAEVVSIRSKRTFTLPLRVQFILSISQRIANNAFYLEVVNLAGDTYAAWLFDSTSATSNKITNANAGQNVTTNPSVGITGLGTGSGGALYEIDLRADGVDWYDRTIDGSTVANLRASRHRNIPKPDEEYYIRIRSVNGGVAPASNTNLVVERVLVQDNTKFVAEVSAGRGNHVSSRALPVTLPAGTTVSSGFISVNPSATSGASSLAKVQAAASTNATLISSAARRVLGWDLANITAAWKYVRLYNKATAPTVGTDVPICVIAIPPNGRVSVQSPYPVLAPSLGLGYSITNGAADLDATAVAANDVIGSILYM